MRRHTIQTAIAMLILTVFLPLLAAAQDISAVVEQALDQQVANIEIADTPLPEALAALETKTGLRFVIAPDVLARMPYGEKTEVSITLRNISVRRAMSQVCAGLGLTMRVAGDRIHLDPSPVLRRLGRRLTADEANLLGRLAGGSWKSLSPLPAIRYEIESGSPIREAFEKALATGGGESAAAELESAARAAGVVWLPAGGAIAVSSLRSAVAARLDQPIDLTYERVALDELLIDLGERIGVSVRIDPGAFQAVGARERAVDLTRRGTTVRQTLERVCGNSGLRYEVTEDGIRISATGAVAPAVTALGPGSAPRRIVAHISVPLKDGALLNVPVYEDELPNAELQRIRADALKAMREALGAGRP
ncbi:MAG: hypothetical protein JNG88_01555 [Phycisphaerales bacterium]|nr:hypothetical protein [Phycisphaerales bacterium]